MVIEDKIKSLTFPSFPTVVLDLLNYLSTETADIKGVESLIKRDLPLTTEILRIANSPLYGMGKIKDIRHALILLGLNTIKYIAISAAVSTLFKSSSLEKETSFNVTEFWVHSIRIGTISKLLAQQIGYQEPDALFVAGLIHDLGRLVLAQSFPDEYKKIIEEAEKDKVASYEHLEKEVLGVTHTKVGGNLFRSWNLPSFLVEVAEKHHFPLLELLDIHVQIVSIAHLIDAVLKLSPSERPFSLGPVYNLVSELWDLKREDLNEIITIAEAETIIAAKSVGITIASSESGRPQFEKKKIEQQTDFLSKFFVFWNILNDLKEDSLEHMGRCLAKAFYLAFRVNYLVIFMGEEERLIKVFPRGDKLKGTHFSLREEDNPIVQAVNQKRSIFIPKVLKQLQDILPENATPPFVAIPFFYHKDRFGVIFLEKISCDRRILKFIGDQIGLKLQVLALEEEKNQIEKEKEILEHTIRKNLKRLIDLEKKGATLKTAAAATHEITQFLSVIQGTAELLLNSLSQQGKIDERLEKRMAKLFEAIERIKDFLRHLTSLREEEIERSWEDIKTLLNSDKIRT